jgi:hypothetical protein
VIQQESPRCVGTVELEPLIGAAVLRNQAQIVEHRRHIEQLRIELQAVAVIMQHAPQIGPAGVIEQEIIAGGAHQFSRFPRHRAVRDHDSSNCFRHYMVSPCLVIDASRRLCIVGTADDRLAGSAVCRAERRGRLSKGTNRSDDWAQPTVAQSAFQRGEPAAIGFNNEKDCPSVVRPYRMLTMRLVKLSAAACSVLVACVSLTVAILNSCLFIPLITFGHFQ